MATSVSASSSSINQMIADTLALESFKNFAGSNNDEPLEMTTPPSTIASVADTIVDYCLGKLQSAASDWKLTVPRGEEIADQISDLHGRVKTALKGEHNVDKSIFPDLVWAYKKGNATLSLTVFFKISIIPKGDKVAIQPSVVMVKKKCRTRVEFDTQVQREIVVPYRFPLRA